MKRSMIAVAAMAGMCSHNPHALAQGPITMRALGAVEATSRDTVQSLNGIRSLSDGRVLVNESGRRRVLLFEKDLASYRVVADSSAGGPAQYGPRATVLFPYAGDSSILIDLAGRALLVLDGNGKVARVMAAPRPNDVAMMASASSGTPAFDGRGRLIYRTMIMPAFKAPVLGKKYDPPVIADSAPLLRADFDTRVADTIAWIRVPRMLIQTTFLPNGGVTLTPKVTPIATIDDWTALPDGSVAILRGADYHLDWIAADGKPAATPKMPFDWRRLTDEEKEAIIDSTRKTIARQAEAAAAGAKASAAGSAAGGHGAAAPGAAVHGMTIMPVGVSDGAPPPQSANMVTQGPQVMEVVPPSELPDYYPPVLRSGLMKADYEGNVWILPSTSL